MTTATATLPAGPSQTVLRQSLAWGFRPRPFLDACHREFGDMFTIRLGQVGPVVMLAHPDMIKEVFTGDPAVFHAGEANVILRPSLGRHSVLLLDDAQHMRQRKLLLPPFHGERMQRYGELMREIAEHDIASWPRGEPFRLHTRTQDVTLTIIVRAVFGVTDPARGERLRELLRALLDATASFGLQFGFMLARRLGAPDPLEKLRRQRAEIDELLLAEIGERRATGGGEDILSLLLDARFEDGAPMADQEVCDQLVTLLVAGHETTATALAWTLELLVHHPDALARLGDGSDTAYLKAVINESLRLRPVVPLAGRRLSAPLQVDGVELPEGTDVTPAIWLAHTRADVYPDPFTFRPERWLDGAAPPGYAWVPFGGGVRRCLGAAFAEMEMRVALATMLALVRVGAATAEPERVARRNVTFSPARGTRLVALQR